MRAALAACSLGSVALTLLLGACAEFRLVDPTLDEKAAVMPRQVSFTYSANEDLTLVTWFAELAPGEVPGQLTLVRGGVEEPVAPLLATGVDTARLDGEAWALILTGLVRDITLRYVPATGVAPIEISYRGEPVVGALALDAALTPDNGRVTVAIHDPFQSGGGEIDVRRRFTVELRDAACIETLASARMSDTGELATPAPFPEAGALCLFWQSHAMVETRALLAHPLLARVAHAYQPPVEASPVIIVPVLNLELPSVEACAATRKLIEETLAATAVSLDPNAVVTVSIAPALGTDGSCRHEDWLLSWETLEAVLGPALPATESRVFLLYVDNLALPMSSWTSWGFEYAAWWASNRAVTFTFAALASAEVLAGYSFAVAAEWTYAADPALGARTDALVRQVLPYRRYVHDAATLVPFAIPAGAAGYKLCTASQPLLLYSDAGGPFVPMGSDGLAGYWVTMPSEWTAAPSFVPTAVTAQLEACLGFCTQPAENWSATPACAW